MALLKDLANQLTPYVDGAPQAARSREFLRAAQEFFERTSAWRAELSSTSVASASQPLVPPADSEVYGVTKCVYGTIELKRMTQEQFRRDYGVSYSGPPVGFRLGAANTLTLMPAATAGNALVVNVILRPTDTATTVDDVVASRHSRVIEEGAMSRLLRMANVPWTNYPLSTEHRTRFDEAIDRQSWLGPDGGVGNPRSVRYGGL